MDEPDETFTVTLSVPSHARWQPQRRLWQPNVDGMRVAVAGPCGHERVTARWPRLRHRLGPRPPVPNERLRYMLIGDARVSKPIHMIAGSRPTAVLLDVLSRPTADCGDFRSPVPASVANGCKVARRSS